MPAHAEEVQVSGGGLRFHDMHHEAKLIHTYQNGERGKSLMVETIGGGAGWLDYDGDGRWDLYLNQGGDPTADPDEHQPNDALFRNLGDGTFEDVTEPAGIREFGYSQGVAIGDYDNDGFDDIYVTNVGGNTLFHNQGDGTFREVTAAAGVRDGRLERLRRLGRLGSGRVPGSVRLQLLDLRSPAPPELPQCQRRTPHLPSPGNRSVAG